ncbi:MULTISPECIES: hypothetical protein [unclassified Sphingobacterium]|uniref:hypothetical protein n=1 Tax=unclassified Sphingobacterium TaxID=2609468 RepID=UPI0025FECDC0|nr:MULTISPECIES: hypothetical protein [unclassified Sphingobacterium]
MFKYLSLLAFSLLLMASCSDKYNELDTDEEIPKESFTMMPLRLETDVKTANIFNMVVFTMKDSSIDELTEWIGLPIKYSDLDSLFWEVEGNPNRVKLLTKGTGSFSLKSEWGHYFYLPGTYKTYLSGYKDNNRVVRDSTYIKINANADFLNVDWNRIDNINQNTGYTNNGTLGYQFRILNRKSGNTFYSGLRVAFDSIDYTQNIINLGNKERDALSAYMTKLYGKANFEGDKELLSEQFKQLFKADVAKDEVLKIWKTPKSNMALLHLKNDEDEAFSYWVHAERAEQK